MNLTIRLIGVKEAPMVNGKATSFLLKKQRGSGVFF